MDDFLLLIIFSYPGVITDLVYMALAKDKTFYHDVSNTFRVARGFFLSALTALITMRLTRTGNKTAHTIENWICLLKTSEILWRYLAISVIVSVAIGFFWYAAAYLRFMYQNERATTTKKGYYNTEFSETWLDVVLQPEKVDLSNAAIVVYNADRKLIACGLPFALPHNIRKEPALALTYCEWVQAEIDKPSNISKLEGLLITYANLDTGYIIEVWDAPALWKDFRDAQKK